MKKTRILLAATSGGHLTEGLALFGNLPGTELILFTEYTPRMKSLAFRSYGYRRVRSPFLTMIPSFFKAFFLILLLRPEWVVSTGAECGTAAILAAKLLFRKTIFVETASRYRTKTMSAKICYPLVDRFYVQWEEALPLYGKKAEYIGGIL